MDRSPPSLLLFDETSTPPLEPSSPFLALAQDEEEALAKLKEGSFTLFLASPFTPRGEALLKRVHLAFPSLLRGALWNDKEKILPKELFASLGSPLLLPFPKDLPSLLRSLESLGLKEFLSREGSPQRESLKESQRAHLLEGLRRLQAPYLISKRFALHLSDLEREGELSLFCFEEGGADCFLLTIEEGEPHPLVSLSLAKDELLTPLMRGGERLSFSRSEGWQQPHSFRERFSLGAVIVTTLSIRKGERAQKSLSSPKGGRLFLMPSLGEIQEERFQEILLSPREGEELLLRKFIEELVSRAPGDRDKLSLALQMMAHELFTNCLSHSALDAQQHQILFRGKLGPEALVLECLDQGAPFDPSLAPFPDFSGAKERGFGLYFIKQMADSLSYLPKRGEGWNLFRIEKKYYKKEEDLMSIHHTSQGGHLLIEPRMEYLDSRLAPTFKREVLVLMEAEPSPLLILDMKAVSFIDSSGFGALLSLMKECKKVGRRLLLVQLTPQAESAFKMLNLDRLFEIHPTLEAALALS